MTRATEPRRPRVWRDREGLPLPPPAEIDGHRYLLGRCVDCGRPFFSPDRPAPPVGERLTDAIDAIGRFYERHRTGLRFLAGTALVCAMLLAAVTLAVGVATGR